MPATASIFRVPENVPSTFMWVKVARCNLCGENLTVNRGAHADRKLVRAVVEFHLERCAEVHRITRRKRTPNW